MFKKRPQANASVGLHARVARLHKQELGQCAQPQPILELRHDPGAEVLFAAVSDMAAPSPVEESV